MKNKILYPFIALGFLVLAGCGAPQSSSSAITDLDPDDSGNRSDGGSPTTVVVDDTPTTPEVDIDGEFTFTTKDGTFTVSNKIYTISTAGTYAVSGLLEEGQILVDAGDEDEVVIELSGATITNSSDSPIKAVNADKVEISAKKNTSNSIVDNRNAKTVDDDSQGEGAISAKCDLKLKGTGTLVVEGNYNNGVFTSKDLTVQKETLYVTALNNALKGKASVTMVSGNVTLVAKDGNGIKTDKTDLSSKGKQRGKITISGGDLVVDSVYDALDASYDVVINEDNEDELTTSVTIKTGKYSTYKANYDSSSSAKGIKAANIIDISGGSIAIQASDDAIHANYGDAIESGGTGQGLINISAGNIGIASGDDGIHADNTLTISGGDINISNSNEGIEANHIVLSGGQVYVYGTDDGVNASRKIDETPSIEISGGFLDVTVSKGDTDGIDSNGTYSQTGGLVISRGGYGSSGQMSTALDADGNAQITGGTFIAFNGMEKTPNRSTNILYAYYGTTGNQGGPGGPGFPGGMRAVNLSSETITFTAGTYTLTGGDMNKTFVNTYSYTAFLIYSSELVIGTTYTLKKGNSEVLSWTQNSSSQKIG